MTTEIRVYLDKDGPGHASGLLRCLEVISAEENGKEKSHPNLIDNKEFASEDLLVAHIAAYFKVSKDRISIEE